MFLPALIHRQEHETKSLKEIIQLPPSALQGLAPAAVEILQSHQVTTIEKLGSWKYLKWAQAIVTLADAEKLNPYDAIPSVKEALFSQVLLCPSPIPLTPHRGPHLLLSSSLHGMDMARFDHFGGFKEAPLCEVSISYVCSGGGCFPPEGQPE